MWQRVGCSVRRVIPNMLWPVHKLELRMSELALLKMKQVLEELLWETTCPLWSPADVVELRISSKYWSKGSKYGPYGELFFFLVEKNPKNKSGKFTKTPLQLCDFARVMEQDSVLSVIL